MRLVIKLHIILVISLLGTEAFAQQDPLFTQYMFNTLAINPAYAGHSNVVVANLIHRGQWVDFDGAPRTQSFTVHAPLRKESLGLGGTVLRDKIGPTKQTGLFLDAAYRIFLDKTRLSFGLKGGVNFYNADLVSLNPVDQVDPLFQANLTNTPLINFGFGVYWHSENWYATASVPKLIKNELIDDNSPIFIENDERRHLFVGGGLVIDLNRYIKFKPTTLLKLVDGSPPSVDLSANFLFYETFWAGLTYRTGDSAGMLFQYDVSKKFRLGYSYDYIISDLSSFSGASHEFLVGVSLGKPAKGDKSPRYF